MAQKAAIHSPARDPPPAAPRHEQREGRGPGARQADEEDRGGGIPGHELRRREGGVERGRLVVPEVRVQGAAVEHLAADDEVGRDVAVQGLVIGVQPAERDGPADHGQEDGDQVRGREDARGGPGI